MKSLLIVLAVLLCVLLIITAFLGNKFRYDDINKDLVRILEVLVIVVTLGLVVCCYFSREKFIEAQKIESEDIETSAPDMLELGDEFYFPDDEVTENVSKEERVDVIDGEEDLEDVEVIVDVEEKVDLKEKSNDKEVIDNVKKDKSEETEAIEKKDNVSEFDSETLNNE